MLSRLLPRPARTPPPTLEVLLATRSAAPLRALARVGVPHRVREAATTRGAYALLAGSHLVVLDADGPDALHEHEVSFAALAHVLREHRLPTCGSAAFAANPEPFLRQAEACTGAVQSLPPRTVVFTGYAGGVGKTSGALDTALTFARLTGLPVGLVEFCSGRYSALHVFTDPRLPTTFTVVNESRGTAAPAHGVWRGASLVPMEQPRADLLEPADLRAWFAGDDTACGGFRGDHILTLVDVHQPHRLYRESGIEGLVDQFFVLADARRPDTVRLALGLAEELRQQTTGAVALVCNLGAGLDSLAVREAAFDLRIPFHPRAELLEGHLARAYLRHLYPFARLGA